MANPSFNLVPGNLALNGVVGNDFSVLFDFDIDLTGYTFEAQVILQNIPNNNYGTFLITETNLEEGRITISLTDAQTKNIGAITNTKWYLSWTIGGNTRTVLSGNFSLNNPWAVTNYSPTSEPQVVQIDNTTVEVTVIGGAGGSVVWGDIQGDIEDQTDLIEYLNTQTPFQFGGPNIEIWLSPRTDGISGTGTLSNPYDASTQIKLDAITDPLYLDDIPNVTIHFLEGSYTTGGVGMRNGWKIIGAGKNKTFITSKNVNGNAAFTTVSDTYSGQSVEGMTIDCNYDANIIVNPNGGFAAVHVAGPDSYISNVKVINSGGLNETFALWVVGSSSVPCDRSYISDCEVLQVKNNCTPITISTISATYSIGNRMENNFVSGNGVCIGLGHGNTNGCIVSGNILFNCGNGIYSDTYGQDATLISDNSIVQCINGIYLTPVPGLNNVSIIGNSIAVSGSGITLPDLSDYTLIQGNSIWQYDGGSGNGVMISGTHSNTRILSNTLGPNQTSSVISTGKNIQWNRQYDGSVSTGLEDSNLSLGGTISATNLSGTNTGDQYGDATSSTASQYLRRNAANDGYEFGNKTDYLTSIPTSGQAIAFNDNPVDQVFYINPAGDLADLQLILPSNSTSIPTQKVVFCCNHNITNLALTGATTIFNAPVAMNAGDCFQFYKMASNVWARVIT